MDRSFRDVNTELRTPPPHRYIPLNPPFNEGNFLYSCQKVVSGQWREERICFLRSVCYLFVTSNMTASGILPTHQRYLNGAPVPSSVRRSFRPREKYLILLVFLTFGLVCFGAFFFLPEFKSGVTGNSVYSVYQQIQKAGPELLIPAPPFLDEEREARKNIIHRHDVYGGVDPHRIEDRAKLLAKIEEDNERNHKVLERPEFDVAKPASSSTKVAESQQNKFDPGDDTSSILTVPPIFADKYPVTYKGEDSDPAVRAKRNKVLEMTKHAWDNYVRYAWGKNELRPISKRAHTSSIFGASSLGLTIVDGLDTLYIMGLHEEFKQGREWIATNLKNLDDINSDFSVFETNIRYVGGLLTCFALTGDVMFRNKAEQIAKKLLPAFHTPTGIPNALVNFKTGASKNYGWASGGSSILSEFGTLHLEFSYLSDVTGNPVFREKVDTIRNVLQNMDKPKGLYPNYLNPKTGKWGQQHMSMGALGDSFYEYLLKAWIQSAKQDHEAREMYDTAMDAVVSNMLQTSQSGLVYFSELKYERVEHKMDHLACFSGGLLALGAQTLRNTVSTKHIEIAEGIANTCHESYVRTNVKLGPESFKFTEAVEAKALRNNDKYYILRPEVIETYFYLWRLTKNQKYRDWGWDAVQALEKHCRTPSGYTGIKNVYLDDPVKDDVQQSFFIAETLKYLYLLFSDDSLISLDEWVYNTEGHPLPIKGVNPYYREHQP